MQGVTLHEILDAREMRVTLQKKLLNEYKTALICFTMNIAGPIKTSSLIERAFFEGIGFLEEKIEKDKIIHKEVDVSHTGCQAMFCVCMDAKKLKAICTQIEDSCPLGRLFDMDVLDLDGKKLSRDNLRGCIVCNASGRECAAGRLHSVEQLKEATKKIITEHFYTKDLKCFATLATDSLLDEVYTTPKPGLVDRRNNGSHTDMDINTFIKSANSLTLYFYECIEIGYKTRNLSPDDTFKQLRKAGIIAEKTMYNATGGVNTHKGAIYSLGVICGALGRMWKADLPIDSIQNIFSMCSEITTNAVKDDFLSIDETSAGSRMYLKYGIKGIRGEAASGFLSVANIGLPIYKSKLDEGLNSNDAGAVTLIHLISSVKDTNLYNRGGSEGSRYAVNRAKQLLIESNTPTKEQIEQLDNDFIERNLSPGGCADLLAVTYFLTKLESYY